MKNKTNKKNSPNRIKCQITGQKRMSNATYLANKGEKNGVTGNVWASFYVSKDAYKTLVAEVAEGKFTDVAFKYGIDSDRLNKWLKYNGRAHAHFATTTLKRDKKKAEVALSTEDAAVALELATAEIERTKEALIEKTQTTDRDRKLARRRELYAAQKNQRAEARALVGV